MEVITVHRTNPAMAHEPTVTETMKLPKRNYRGPLRALHTNETLSIVQKHTDECDRTTAATDSESYENVFRSQSPETMATPVLRARHRASMERNHSFENQFPQPLRASSYRASKSPKQFSGIQSAEDIRHHFRVRGGAASNAPAAAPLKPSCTVAVVTPGPGDLSTCSPTSVRHVHTACKRHGTNDSDELCSDRKQQRFSDRSLDAKPIPMSMGAYVKTHPRYRRRSSGTDAAESLPHAVTMQRRLSPICPVPMPTGFPSLPVAYTGVPLPWDRSSELARDHRTVETQTSPPPQPDTPRAAEDSHCRSLRQSLGSSQVLNSLKCTFGNLRRAISAGRLHRSSQGPFEQKAPIGSDGPGIQVSSGTGRIRLPRIGSKRRDRAGRRRSTCSESQLDQVQSDGPLHSEAAARDCSVSLCGRLTQTVELATDSLTCHVVGTYPDGSIRVQLRRPDVTTRFGFFIARDAQGIFISRLGSVRSTVKLWDVLHVGDRLLEVQGVPCARLEVDDVHNLIRGCELVEFRVRAA